MSIDVIVLGLYGLPSLVLASAKTKKVFIEGIYDWLELLAFFSVLHGLHSVPSKVSLMTSLAIHSRHDKTRREHDTGWLMMVSETSTTTSS